MDYASVFTSEPPESVLDALFTDNFNRSAFASALEDAVAPLWARNSQNTTVARVFRHGARKLAVLVGKNGSIGNSSNGGSDLTSESPKNSELADSGPLPDHDIAFSAHSRHSSLAGIADEPSRPVFDEEDIADLGSRSSFTGRSSFSGPRSSFGASSVGTSVGAMRKLSIAEDASETLPPPAVVAEELAVEKTVENVANADVDVGSEVSHVAIVLQAFFTELCVLSQKKHQDVFPLVFGVPAENDPDSSEHHLLVLLQNIKQYISSAVESHDVARAGSLKDLILLLHEILRAFVAALSFQSSSSAIVVKRLLFTFFAADLSQTVLQLLAVTTGNRPFENSESDSDDSSSQQKLRLSYETFLNTQSIFAVLAMCPVDMIIVNKVSLSLDITARHDSPNGYATAIHDIEFTDDKVSSFRSTAFPFLAAQFNYYYQLHPDLMLHTLTHSSFFSWLLANKFSSVSYLATETTNTVTAFPATKLDVSDPFVAETEYYECSKKISRVNGNVDSEFAVHSPTFLLNTLVLLAHTKNTSFVSALCKSDSDEHDLLAAWLCVSSYISHYQYRTVFNRYATRLSLLVMLKLTSSKLPYVAKLRRRSCNENVWKLCHHKTPLVPIYNTDGKKASLLYIVNVLQSTLRYNFSKKLDLENAKLSLTVLYQILTHYESHISDELSVFAWNEVYQDLVHFIKFVSKNFNEEAVKIVIEEAFSVINLLLSSVFNQALVKDSSFLFGSHLAKSINYDLLYLMLQQYESLKAIFEKYIIRKGNFGNVQRTFDAFAEFYQKERKEVDDREVTDFLSKLSILNDQKDDVVSIDPDSFNYAETFKYLDTHNDHQFANPHELLEIFKVILDYKWTKKFQN